LSHRQVIFAEEQPQIINRTVSEWLHSLELDAYVEHFHAAGYTTVHDIVDISAADLQQIGVVSAAHQRILLHAADNVRETINMSSTI